MSTANANTRRLFIALRPPLEIAERLRTQAIAALDLAEWRVYGVGDIHLTLCFLGATPSAFVPVLCANLEREIAALPAVDLQLAGVGAFPSMEKARALWVGVRGQRHAAGLAATREQFARLSALERAVFRAVRAAELDPDESSNGERFQPHLTLARPRIGRRTAMPDGFRKLVLDETWHADRVHLFETCAGDAEIERHPSIAEFRCRPANS